MKTPRIATVAQRGGVRLRTRLPEWIPVARAGLALCLVSACSTGTTGPSKQGANGAPQVTLSIEPSSITPSQSSVITTSATAPAGGTLTAHNLELRGLLDTTFRLPIVDPHSQAYELTLTVPTAPIQGRLDVTASASAGSAVATMTGALYVRNPGPP